MQKELGKEYKHAREREAFLKDNCDKVEEKGYMKPFTPEQLQGHKESLANVSISIDEIEMEKKEAMEHYKGQLKPLAEQRKQMVYQGKSRICQGNMFQVHRPGRKNGWILQFRWKLD